MVEFRTNIWYDDSLLERFNGDHSRLKGWINNVLSIVKYRFVDESLEMKIQLEIDEEIKHAKGMRLKADQNSLKLCYL